MFPNFLSFLPGNLPGLFISSIITFLGGIYLGYNYQTNYYEAKISKDSLNQEKAYKAELTRKQSEKDLAIAQLFKALQAEQSKSSSYQSQAKSLYLANANSNPGPNCYVSYGFIRLFNASATGESTSSTSSDSATSPIDLATVLSTTIENHGKYRQAARQVEAIRAAE